MLPPDALGELEGINAAVRALAELTGGPGDGIGSNSWALSGEHTPTASPMLMNDPHLSIQMPSIWYQVGLHCRTVTPECPYNVAGFSFAGVPGVIIGHNADIAWGFTNTNGDWSDLIELELDPSDPSGYYKVATFHWDKAYRDRELNDTQKNEYADLGIEAVDKALEIRKGGFFCFLIKSR